MTSRPGRAYSGLYNIYPPWERRLGKEEAGRDEPSVLIVDDKVRLCKSLARNFEHVGYGPSSPPAAGSCRLWAAHRPTSCSWTSCSARRAGSTSSSGCWPSTRTVPVIMITAYASVETAVQSLKLGAFDYVRKPLDFDELLKTVEKACEFSRLREENVRCAAGSGALGDDRHPGPAHARAGGKVEKLAATDLPVLICGESGTGKEVFADFIHAASARGAADGEDQLRRLPRVAPGQRAVRPREGGVHGRRRAFKGLFEKANGSTLFLDEIGDMPSASRRRSCGRCRTTRSGGSAATRRSRWTCGSSPRQTRTWGADQEKPVPRGPLLPAERRGAPAPPLRERGTTSPSWWRISSQRPRTRPRKRRLRDADAFLAYDWPGNVRELKNMVCYAASIPRGSGSGVDDLPVLFLDEARGAGSNLRDDMERLLILRSCRARRQPLRAAELLRSAGIPCTARWKYGLDS